MLLTVITLPTIINDYLSDDIKDYEIGEACGTHGTEENWIQFLNGKFSKEKDSLKGLDADETIIIKNI